MNSLSEAQENKTVQNTLMKREMKIIQDNSFGCDGFQVVRGEFFSHVYEPCITFNNYKVYVNTACVKKLPDTDYIQILVNPTKKKLAVRPCLEEDKDSVRWCSATTKRSPKQITCPVFFAKVISLMGWNPDYRYRLVGKLIQSNDKFLFVFDLDAPEIFVRTIKDGKKPQSSRTPSYPAEWKYQFGIPSDEHQKSLRIDIFNEYTVFSMQEKPAKTPKTKEREEPEYGNQTEYAAPGIACWFPMDEAVPVEYATLNGGM